MSTSVLPVCCLWRKPKEAGRKPEGSRDQSQISPEPHKARSTKFPGAGWRHRRGSRRELLRQFEIGPSVQTLRIIRASGPCGDREDDWRSVGPSRCVPPADRGADDRALAHSEMLEPAVGYLTALYGVVRAGYAGGVTFDVETVTGRKPITFETFAELATPEWK